LTDDGYASLRRNLRERLRLDEIRASRNRLTARIRVLIDRSGGRPLTSALTAFLRSLGDLAEACLACSDTSIERSVLIERQIDQLEFVGRLHDEYHEATRRFDSQYNSVVQHAKRLANSVASLIYEILPHDQRRGVRTGSFGRMYGALKIMSSDLPEPLDSVRRLVTEHGEYLESVVHQYRDDAVEHPRLSSRLDLGATWTSDDRVDFVRTDRDPGTEGTVDRDLDPRWPGFLYRDFHHNGHLVGYQFLVHVHGIFDFEPGQLVTEETEMGFVTDGGFGHFDDFGPHSHVFSSRDIPKFLLRTPTPIYGMPGVADMIALYASMAADALDIVDLQLPHDSP